MIQPIVEGHGEMEAVPVLLRRLLAELQVYHLAVRSPIRRTRSELVGKEEVYRKSVRVARVQPDVSAVFVILDLDDDCARDIVSKLLTRGQEEASPLPLGVTLARREYEAWFLAALDSLRGKRGIRGDASYVGDPEAVRDAKGNVSRLMPRNLSYAETADQAALSAQFDLYEAFRRASSFRKLVKELYRVLIMLGLQPVLPPEWAVCSQ